MIEGIIGKKIGMSQIFDESGNVIPVTVIQAGPCTVIQRKTKAKDKYVSVQLGFVEGNGVRKPVKAQVGHFKKSGSPVLKKLREVRCLETSEVKEGDQILVDIFEIGEKVHIVGTSKGKGFAGVVRRYNFRGGGGSHGSMFHRAPGSIGASSYPSRVVRGMRMGGHMGTDRVTVKNLVIIDLDKENNLLVVRGAVPGAKGGYLLIKKGAFRRKTA